jgi:hypothetical protein
MLTRRCILFSYGSVGEATTGLRKGTSIHDLDLFRHSSGVIETSFVLSAKRHCQRRDGQTTLAGMS